MSYDIALPLDIGAKSTSTALDGLVGAEFVVRSALLPGVSAPPGALTRIRLVQATAAAANATLVLWAASTGPGAGTVAGLAGANALPGTVAGSCILSSAAASGDKFWVAVSGPAFCTTSAAVALGAQLQVTASGTLDDGASAADTTVGWAMNAIGSGTTGTVRLDLP
jgi:hypothetical protein